MKKAATGAPAPSGVEEYLAAVPEPARTTLNKIRASIRAAVGPAATERISYGMPAFHYQGPLMAYGAFARHCSLFPMSVSVIEAFQEELKDYRTSKGTLQFPLDKPLPAALVKKLVRARMAQNELKKKH